MKKSALNIDINAYKNIEQFYLTQRRDPNR